MIRLLIILAGLLGPIGLYAQKAHPNLDVTMYHYSIVLSDETDVIEVDARVYFTVRKACNEIRFDLAHRGENGLGMKVNELKMGGSTSPFTHKDEELIIESILVPEDTIELRVRYSGIPANGLIIRKNKNNERTFFGDHWPNRAHQYLVGNDHLSDKALFKWNITAPPGYRVIHSDTSSVLPLKVSVFGVAPFTITEIPSKQVRQFAYSYPDDSVSVFEEVSSANEIMSYFESIWGEYPFKQLNHVQSTTLFGGMENAGCIFYDERAISDGLNSEDLVAHEMAHQWFGNCVTESDWPHLWLSEGFATYGEHLFMQHKYGDSLFYSRLRNDEQAILRRAQANPNAVIVDFETTDLMSRLNAYSYQKGGRILHMIRTDIGLDRFHKLLAAYFERFKYGVASTDDFMNLLDEFSHEPLSSRYEPWLTKPTIPELNWAYQLQPDQGIVTLDIQQEQEVIMPMKLPVLLEFEDGSFEELYVELNEKTTSQQWVFDRAVRRVQLDPNKDWLWLEAVP